jgi:hypothetical protein
MAEDSSNPETARILSDEKGSATVSVAPVGVPPTESNGRIAHPSVSAFRTTSLVGRDLRARRVSFTPG